MIPNPSTKAHQPPPARVTMYTRQGCHLCEDAWHLLEQLRNKYHFDLEAIDVDAEADLLSQYGERVPVVVIDGKERFWGRINPILLERSLGSTAN